MNQKDEKTSIWTLPNRLSMLRILFIPAIILLISSQKDGYLFASGVLFIIAGITDGLDGWLARRLSMTTKLGLYLDPIADKLLVSSVLITLSVYGLVPLWVTIVLVCREFLINGLRSFYAVEGVTIFPSYAGKLKTTLQIVGISFILCNTSVLGRPLPGVDRHLHQIGRYIIYAALCFSVYSAYHYMRAIFRPPQP
ncbi:MAG: CDP-diacylglycerol--glycerol-3-phosphate 3-phosphatidyltransferase [Syntrophorhabdales bacterium]